MKQPQYLHQKPKGIYATEYANRHPQFKVHATLGHARRARSQWVGRFAAAKEGEWVVHWGNNIEKAKGYVAFDVFKLIDDQWVHLPEESLDPEDFEYELRDYVTNQWMVNHRNAEPQLAKRVHVRPKQVAG